MKLFKIAITILSGLTLLMVSCSDGEDGINGKDGINGENGINGQDGTDGTDGQNGTNGTNGENGTDGQNGTNGENGTDGAGFDELVKYGSITLKLEGIRADTNAAFQDSTSFKFSLVNANHIPTSNGVYLDVDTYIFNVKRFLSAPEDSYQNSYAELFFEVTNPGEEFQDLGAFSLEISDYFVIGDDYKYFIFNGNMTSLSPEEDGIVQDVAFDPTTNHLTFSYSFTILGAENVTGNDLHISGEVDIIALEAL